MALLVYQSLLCFLPHFYCGNCWCKVNCASWVSLKSAEMGVFGILQGAFLVGLEGLPNGKSFWCPWYKAQIKLSSRQVSRALDLGITTYDLKRFLDLVLLLHFFKEIHLCPDQLTKRHVF